MLRARYTRSDGLTEFPTEIYALADTLEVLDLSGNQLSSLPDDLPRLHKLRVLFCSDNQFTTLPPVLGQCPQLRMVGFKANQIATVPAQALPPRLRWLTLTDNQITELPAEIGQCTDLQKLMLAGNRLHALPATLSACHQLELVRVAANALTQFPAWLLALPRLSWLAFAGNPFCAERESAVHRSNTLPDIPWSALQLQDLLGQGASGVIHQATETSTGTARQVAVKRFKGAMTSDGLPSSEMAACLAAGSHAHRIALLGRLRDEPLGAEGLVMARVGPEFQNLALPPSLDSCTRDVYPAARRFDLLTALRIATGVAAAVGHLHARGILHGDVYGHNTLYTPQGAALLGDLGAASLYDATDQNLGTRLQQLEARAFGCLLEELLDRTETRGAPERALATLRHLQARCLDPSPTTRPRFDAIEAVLRTTLDAATSH